MILILNFKNYPESTGIHAMNLSKVAHDFASYHPDIHVIICPQTVDLELILEKNNPLPNFQIWAQHVDFQMGEKNTGYLTAETLLQIGVTGSLLNHAEHKVEDIKKYTEIDDKLDLCLCVSDLVESKIKMMYSPDFSPKYIAYEPPNLIGGNISVSQSNGHDIEQIVDFFPKNSILVGAGVKTGKDVKKSIGLGAKGVLIASGFVFASSPMEFLEMLIS